MKLTVTKMVAIMGVILTAYLIYTNENSQRILVQRKLERLDKYLEDDVEFSNPKTRAAIVQLLGPIRDYAQTQMQGPGHFVTALIAPTVTVLTVLAILYERQFPFSGELLWEMIGVAIAMFLLDFFAIASIIPSNMNSLEFHVILSLALGYRAGTHLQPKTIITRTTLSPK